MFYSGEELQSCWSSAHFNKHQQEERKVSLVAEDKSLNEDSTDFKSNFWLKRDKQSLHGEVKSTFEGKKTQTNIVSETSSDQLDYLIGTRLDLWSK